MKKLLIKTIATFFFGCSLFATAVVTSVAEETKQRTVQEVVRLFLQNYPSINIARIEIERAQQEFSKIESQLGWVVQAQSGVSRDIGIFNIPSERFDASASIGTTQKSGNRVEITGQYSYEDSDSVAIPSIANPSERTTLDLNYRIPFGQGDDNPDYTQGLVSAEAGLKATEASRIKEIDGLVQQTMQLYYDAANTYMRIKDANKAIDRAERLLKYIQKNQRLGLAERKDLLNVEALLSGKIADRDILLIIWSRQRSELNKLIGLSVDKDFTPVIDAVSSKMDKDVILERVFAESPDILLQEALLKSAMARIELASDIKKDRFDVVLSVGARNTSGDTATGNIDDTEWAGGARLEYQFFADQRGFDAQLYQSMLEKISVEEEIGKLKRDLTYNVNGILEQIERNSVSAKSSKRRLTIEKEKVDESFQRYKLGRADTTELIDNENAYFASSLLYETRKIELARKYSELELLLGALWDRQAILGATEPR